MEPGEAQAWIEREREMLESVNQRVGHPRPPGLPDRAQLEHAFCAARPNDHGGQSDHTSAVIISHIYPPCTRPIVELTSIAISGLRLETVHHNCRLVLRTIGHPKVDGASLNAVEDAHGNVDRLAVHHCASESLRKGNIIVVKEPYYRTAGDGALVIRVDHPGNIVRVRDDDDLVPQEWRQKSSGVGAKWWKEEGNASYQQRDYLQAIECYSRGLDQCNAVDDLSKDLHRNRAMANMYLGRYEFALGDAKAAVIPSARMTEAVRKLNSKAYYRAGCAAYHLERYASAAAYFESVLELQPQDDDAQIQLRRAKDRLDEQASGQYDFEAMTRSQLKAHESRLLDHASFTINVAVQHTDQRGRGLFATCNFEAGDLILCEKAFCVTGMQGEAETGAIIHLKENTVSIGTHAARLDKVIQKLLYSPAQAARFFELYDHNYQPRPSAAVVDGTVPVDTFQVHDALDYNGFSCPHVASSAPISLDDDENSRPTGVWLVSSAINHDCIGNVSRSFVGDMLLLRANRKIQAGEELTMRYRNPENSIDGFHHMLQKIWNFTCTCKLCTAELQVPGYQRNIRASNVTQVAKLMTDHPVVDHDPPKLHLIRQVEQLRNAIADTYSDVLFRDLPRPALHMVQLWLCMAYATNGMLDAVLDTARLVLRDLGVRIEEDGEAVLFDGSHARLDTAGIHAAMYVAQSERIDGRMSMAQQYQDFAKEIYLLLRGSMHGFQDVFPRSS